MSESLLTFSTDEIDIQYKETFLTDALNRKLAGVVPVGVHRGFLLGISGSTDVLRFESDLHVDGHVAVIENAADRSVTLRRTGATFDLDVSALRSAAPDTWVITIWAKYEQGKNTGAHIRAYTVPDYNGAVDKATLVVLGRLTLSSTTPAIILSSELSHEGRTSAWQNTPSEQIPWIPVVKNGGFEGADTTAHRAQIPYWSTSEDTVVAGALWRSSSDVAHVDTGDAALLLDAATTVLTLNVQAAHYVGYYVREGERARVRLRYKVLQVVTGGTGVAVQLSWRSELGGTITTAIPVDVSATTAGFVDTDTIVDVPTTCLRLEDITIRSGGGATVAAAGAVLAIDSFQVWVEPNPVETRHSLQGDGSLESTVITFPEGVRTWRGQDPILRNVLGDLQLDRALSTTPFVPGMRLKGPIRELGTDLLDTLAAQTIPRVKALYQDTEDTSPGDTLTLVQEYAGLASAEGAVRIYVDDTGKLIRTTNAYYSALGTWTRDRSDRQSVKITHTLDGEAIYARATADNTTAISWGGFLPTISLPSDLVGGSAARWLTPTKEAEFTGVAPWTADFAPNGAAGKIRVGATGTPTITQFRGTSTFAYIASGAYQGWYSVGTETPGVGYYEYELRKIDAVLSVAVFPSSGTVDIGFYQGTTMGTTGFGFGLDVTATAPSGACIITRQPDTSNIMHHLSCKEGTGSTFFSVRTGGDVVTKGNVQAESFSYYFPASRWFEIDIISANGEGWVYNEDSTGGWWECTTPHADNWLRIPLNLPDGADIDDLTILVNPSPNSTAYELTEYGVADWGAAAARPVRTVLETTTTSASGLVKKSISVSPDITIDRGSLLYYVEVEGATTGIKVYALRAQLSLAGPDSLLPA